MRIPLGSNFAHCLIFKNGRHQAGEINTMLDGCPSHKFVFCFFSMIGPSLLGFQQLITIIEDSSRVLSFELSYQQKNLGDSQFSFSTLVLSTKPTRLYLISHDYGLVKNNLQRILLSTTYSRKLTYDFSKLIKFLKDIRNC